MGLTSAAGLGERAQGHPCLVPLLWTPGTSCSQRGTEKRCFGVGEGWAEGGLGRGTTEALDICKDEGSPKRQLP